MAHPHRKQAVDGHNAKLKRMTDGYGLASGAANNRSAPTNRYAEEGPMDDVGFGADSTKPRGRADRASREQEIANPVATLRRGGRTKKRADGGRTQMQEAQAGQLNSAQQQGVSQANNQYNEALQGPKRARGGRTKKHGNTHVNVIVAPQGAGADKSPVVPVPPVAGAMPPPAAAMPPKPPMAPPGGPPMGPGGPPMAPGAPGGIPPGLIPPRKRGGKVEGVEGGLGGDAMMAHSRKEQGLTPARAHGGRAHHHMTAGAATGIGRLEKIGEEPKKGKLQVV